MIQLNQFGGEPSFEVVAGQTNTLIIEIDGARALTETPPGSLNFNSHTTRVSIEVLEEGGAPLGALTSMAFSATGEAGALSQDGAIRIGVTDTSGPPSGVGGHALLQGRSDNAGTEITLFQEGVPLEPTLFTSADGSFAADLEPGSYLLRAGHPGWLTEARDFDITEPGQRIDLGVFELRAGDADGDNDVDIDDLNLFRTHLVGGSASLGLSEPAYVDVNGDGRTDILDLVYAAKNLGISGQIN